ENVDQGAGLQEVQTQDLMDYQLAHDREQHLACELFGYREDSNEAAFAVAVVEKIYAHKSLTFNNTIAYEVIFKSKARLKEDMDVRSDVYVLSNGCKKSSDDSHDYYWLRFGLPWVCWLKQREIYLGHSTLSLEDSLSRDCDVEKNDVGMLDKFDRGLQIDVQVFVNFDYAMGLKEGNMAKGTLDRVKIAKATSALVKGGSRSKVPAQVEVVAYCQKKFFELLFMALGGSDQNAEYALSKLLQMGTVAEYKSEDERFTIAIGKPNKLTAHVHVQDLEQTTRGRGDEPNLQSRQNAIVARNSLQGCNIYEGCCQLDIQFSNIEELQENQEEHICYYYWENCFSILNVEEASPVVKRPLDASKDTFISLRSEDPNFKIQENAVEYVRALNAAPLEVVFTGPVDEVRDMFAEFSEDKGCLKKVLSATKLPEGGNSQLAYSSYHLEGKVIFEEVGSVSAWVAEGGRMVLCYVQGSGRRKRKKGVGCGSGRQENYESERRDCGRIRIWDPGINNFFLDITLRTR
ncbi:zinc finger, CCHC-type containing protein, partial [Tanacetum coccineum]